MVKHFQYALSLVNDFLLKAYKSLQKDTCFDELNKIYCLTTTIITIAVGVCKTVTY